MNKINILKVCFFTFLFMGILFSSCDDDDENESVFMLNSWGPSPALRGGELKFIGTNLDDVSSIVLPQNVEVTTFVSKTSEMIVIAVPEETVNGTIVLKTSMGDITPKTILTISEPITISSFSPAKVRPGGMVTIMGTYLNLITEVIFADKKSVTEFESQTKTELLVKVPADAQTGVIVISNGEEEPILVESETSLEVNLPSVVSIAPNPVKAGAQLVLSGTDLDLVKSMLFQGGLKVTDFVGQTAEELPVTVPVNAKEGTITLKAFSGVDVEISIPLSLVQPVITEIAPNPAKTGGEITIKGSDLDLVTGVVFGGEVDGEILAQDAAMLTVKVPETAMDGVITLNTASDMSVVSSDVLTLTLPTIASFTPNETKTNAEIIIEGTDLDIVSAVMFAGDLSVEVTNLSETSIVIKVPSGTVTGPFSLITTNGNMVVSSTDLVILASNVPIITSMPASAKPGEVLQIEGEKLDLFTDIIFPGGIYATAFGVKSPTYLEVIVPMDAEPGAGTLTFITIDNETTESPEFIITAADPVQDWDLVFFDFDGNGDKDSWWGAVSLDNEVELTLNGTSYGRINSSYNGWSDLFWRNSASNFPGEAVGTDVNDYVIKFDINVLAPITGGNIKMRLQGTEGDFWWAFGPEAPPDAGVPGVVEVTNGWTTITIPISNFKDDFGWGANSPTDMSAVNDAFGMVFDNGESLVNICIDNVRFERK